MGVGGEMSGGARAGPGGWQGRSLAVSLQEEASRLAGKAGWLAALGLGCTGSGRLL